MTPDASGAEARVIRSAGYPLRRPDQHILEDAFKDEHSGRMPPRKTDADGFGLFRAAKATSRVR